MTSPDFFVSCFSIDFAAGDLFLCYRRRNPAGRTLVKRNIFYEITRAFVQAYSRLMLRMDVQTHAALPEGPKLFVANHPSATDPILIHLLERMSVLITANAFAFPLMGSFLRRLEQVPVAPGGDALQQATRLLQQGKSVCIFPEGTYSPQAGGFGQPRSGAARIGLSTGVPVIPVGIFLPRERSIRITSNLIGRPTIGYWYLQGPYVVTIGKAMQFQGDVEDRECVHSVTDTLMDCIKALAEESEKRLRGGLAPVY
jgi:1-acyl-sn-glycerol-3-phosphate acyltransferase